MSLGRNLLQLLEQDSSGKTSIGGGAKIQIVNKTWTLVFPQCLLAEDLMDRPREYRRAPKPSYSAWGNHR